MHRKVRTVWDEEQEKWYFSIVDVVEILTDSADPKQYVKKMKARDPELGSNWGTICTLVDMKGKDGRMHEQIILPRSKTADLQQLAENFDRFKASRMRYWLPAATSPAWKAVAE